jgi:hypothetical protein
MKKTILLTLFVFFSMVQAHAQTCPTSPTSPTSTTSSTSTSTSTVGSSGNDSAEPYGSSWSDVQTEGYFQKERYWETHDKIVNYDELRGTELQEPSADDLKWFYEQQKKEELGVENDLNELDQKESELKEEKNKLEKEEQRLKELEERKNQREKELEDNLAEQEKIRDRMARFLKILDNPDISEEAKQQIADQLSDLQNQDIELSRQIRDNQESKEERDDALNEQKNKVEEAQNIVDVKEQEVQDKKAEVDAKMDEVKKEAEKKAEETTSEWQERKEALKKEQEAARQETEDEKETEQGENQNQENKDVSESQSKSQAAVQPETQSQRKTRVDHDEYKEDVTVDDSGVGGLITDPGAEEVAEGLSEKIIGNEEGSNNYKDDEGLKAFQFVYRYVKAKESLEAVSSAVIEGTLSEGLKGLKAAGKGGQELADAIENAMETYDNVKGNVEKTQQALDILKDKLGVEFHNQTWETGNITVIQSTIYNKKTGEYVSTITSRQGGAYRAGSAWTTFADRKVPTTTRVITGKVTQDKSWF